MKILLILICSLGVNAQNRAANRLKCTDEKTGRVSEACALIMLDYPDNEDNVDFDDFLEPPDFNLEEAAAQITEGSGWYLIKGVFSAEDVELARDRVLFFENPYNRSVKSEFRKNADNHNNYEGLLWGLLNKGKIFEKLVQHPAILGVSKRLLGENCVLSSLAANTVLPGMSSQIPHLDYPYYDYLFPEEGNDAMNVNKPLSLQFVTLLTDFTKANGGTAIVPASHKSPAYPRDPEAWYAKAVQVEAKAGDVIVFAGAMQHCAMANKDRSFRSAILQHMVPVYIRPFENFIVTRNVKLRASEALRKLLALDHPYPVRKD